MFDLPSFLPDGAIGVAIVESSEGWSVVVFKTPQHMLMHSLGEKLYANADYVSAYSSHNLIDCIHYVHSVNVGAIHQMAWGE